MYCAYCGSKIPDGCAFCPECGADLRGRSIPPEQETVNEQEYYYEQPMQQDYQYQQFQQDTQFQQAVMGVSKKETLETWPAACGVMGILALVFYLIGQVASRLIMGTGFNISSSAVVYIFVFIIMIVIFFIHTRKIPWVTILPFLILIINMIVSRSSYMFDSHYLEYAFSNWRSVVDLLQFAIPMLMFLFYVLIALIRPSGSALKIFFMIFMAIEIFTLCISMFSFMPSGLFDYEIFNLISIIFIRIALIFFYIGYGVAAMAVPSRW